MSRQVDMEFPCPPDTSPNTCRIKPSKTWSFSKILQLNAEHHRLSLSYPRADAKQFWESIGHVDGKVQRTDCLLEESHFGQKWPALGPLLCSFVGWEHPESADLCEYCSESEGAAANSCVLSFHLCGCHSHSII